MVFFREKNLSYLMKASSGRRGFFFSLQAGFQKPLDPVSGMTVSLPDVDRWLDEAAANYPEGELTPEELLLAVRDELSERAEASGVSLVAVTLKEERHWALAWTKDCEEGHLLHRTSHYEEVLHEEKADLWRIEMTWTKSVNDDFDYFHESLQVLKSLPRGHKKRPERKLSPTSFLSGLSIESRREGWTLEL